MTNNVWTSFIEQLKGRCDIVDVIGQYITVKAQGRSFWACCPFHHEKTPSFSINKQGQYYKCFGCGTSGDVINFVKEYNSLTFVEACEFLARQANLTMPSYDGVNDAKVTAIKKEKEICYSITVAAAQYYNAQLFSEKGSEAIRFLTKRGLSRNTILKFGLGFSPDFNGLVNHLDSLKLPLETAVKCGVLAINSSKKYYDALYGRVIIPIINMQSQVIGFGGRILQASTFAKYKNTAASPIFDKSKSLFGINLVKQIKQTGNLNSIIIVEGYMDAIALNQAGITNVVASMGTSLTIEQAKQIFRLCNNVYICYDGDSAGQAATLRGLDILKQEGLSVKVVQMPKDVDPDELVNKQGAAALQTLIDNALPLVDYKLSIIKNKHKIDSTNISNREEAKRQYLIETLAVVNAIDNLVEKESYITYLVKQTGFTLDFIKSQLTSDKSAITKKTEKVKVEADKALYYIVACLLYNKPYSSLSDLNKVSHIVIDPVVNASLDYIIDCEANNKQINPSMLYNLVEDNCKPNVDYLLQIPYIDDVTDQQYYKDCIKSVYKTSYVKMITNLESDYLLENDTAKRKEILLQISNIQQQLKQLQ